MKEAASLEWVVMVLFDSTRVSFYH